MRLFQRVLRSCFDEGRFACRSIGAAPGFSALAILTLTLGVGANTAIFSIAEAVMFRPLPYPASKQIVSLFERRTDRGDRMSVSVANLADYERGGSSIESLAGYASVVRTFSGLGTPEQLRGEAVTASYFRVLDVRPTLGRPFLPAEDRAGGARVVIISDGLWRSRFNADPGVIGQAVLVNGQSHEIVGVMSRDFRGLTDWTAPSLLTFLIPAAYSNAQLNSRGDHEITVAARLKAGHSAKQAQIELDSVSRGLGDQYPDSNRNVRANVVPFVEDIVRDVRSSLVVLLGATGFLLLIGCASLSNLLVARAVGQRRQIALRLAFGASHRRMLLHVLMHGLVLGVLGGVAGLVVGVALRDLLVLWGPASMPRLDAVELNWRVLAMTSLAAIGVATLSGFVPSIQVMRTDVAATLRGAAATATGSRSVVGWRSHLVSIQVAAALILAIGAGLMIRSLAVIQASPLGFGTERVLTMMLNLPPTRYPDPQRRLAFFTDLTDRVQEMPGVDAAAFANQFPMRGGWGGGLLVDESPDAKPVEVDLQAVSSGYFSALRIPLVQGRLLAPTDRDNTPPVAVVSETFVRRHFPNTNVLGRRIRRNVDAPFITIVGVVGEVRRGGRTAGLTPQIYLSAAQTGLYPVRLSAFAVRTQGNPRALLESIQRQVWAIDREQAIGDVRTLDEVLAAAIAPRRFDLLLLALFAGVALALAIVGVYGVVTYATIQRTSEIAIRMCLGAVRRDVVAVVLRSGVRSVVVGLAVGLIGATVATRLMRGILYGVEPLDLTTYVVTAAVLTLVTLAATVLPVTRAMRIDPLAALRPD